MAVCASRLLLGLGRREGRRFHDLVYRCKITSFDLTFVHYVLYVLRRYRSHFTVVVLS